MADATVQALCEQLACYRRLARLTELQHRHVQQSQTEALLEVLKSRQGILEQITSLENSIRPSKSRWQDFLAELNEDDRTLAQSTVGESRKLLEQITASDQNDALVLQQRKLSIGNQIGKTTAARTINKNYAAAAYGRARPTSRVDISQ